MSIHMMQQIPQTGAVIDLDKSEKSNYLKAGLLAELKVYQDLLKAGFNVHKSDQSLPYDLLVEKNGKCLRVQVKHTSCFRSDRNSYQFKTNRCSGRLYTKKDADVFALVTTEAPCVFYSQVEIINKPNFYVKKHMFELNESTASREKCFAKINQDGEFDDSDRLLKKRLACAVVTADSFCKQLVSDFRNDIENDERFSSLALVESYISYALEITPKWLLQAALTEPLNGRRHIKDAPCQ